MSTIQIVVKPAGQEPAYVLETSSRVQLLQKRFFSGQAIAFTMIAINGSCIEAVAARNVPPLITDIRKYPGTLIICHKLPGGGIQTLTDAEAVTWKRILNLEILGQPPKHHAFGAAGTGGSRWRS